MIELRPYQIRAVHQIFAAWRTGARSVICVAPTGCHQAGQLVLMHDGSTKAVEDVAVGDMLLGPDSAQRVVLALHRGQDEMFQVKPVKGRPFIVNRGHILTLAKTRDDCRAEKAELVDESVDWWLGASKWQKHLHKLVRSSEVSFLHNSGHRPFSGYFLGVVLGDGCVLHGCHIRTADIEILASIREEAAKFGLEAKPTKSTVGDNAPNYSIAGPRTGGVVKNPIVQALKEIEVFGRGAATKHVPASYKTADIQIRLEVLAGLIDTDGSLSGGGYDFISKSRRLADDVAFLSRSVGLAAYVRPCRKSSQNGTTGDYYRVSISGETSKIPCRVQRKIASTRRQKKDALRTGFCCVSQGNGNYYGFSLSGDGRYLLDDFTITHNSGKRYLALWLLDYAAKAGRRVLFVGNRRLLITQAQTDAERHGIDHGVIMANNEGGNPASGNQIASIQTLESWHFYEKYTGAATGEGLPPADLVVIDEIHQDTGRYQQLLRFYPNAKVLGLTATPVGAEGRSLVPSPYDMMVEPVLNSELIYEGHLLSTRVFAPSEPNLKGVGVVQRGEYNQSRLGRAVQACTVFADVFKEWECHQDRATVCFVPGVAFGRDLVSQFNSRLGQSIQAHLIEAKTKPDEREEIFGRIESGDSKVLVSVDVLREGWDCPRVSLGIDHQPNSQLRSYWQKVGRIKRPFVGQREAIWLDFSGNYWRFPHPDEDPEWPVGGEETTQEAIERTRKTKGESEPIMCPRCSLVRVRGPECPGCGYTSSQPVRKIRMGPGELVEVPAVKRKAKEISDEQRLYGKWKGRLYAALRSGATYSQAAMLFRRETGEWPRGDWPGVFEKSSLEWRRKPADLYDRASLYRALERE